MTLKYEIESGMGDMPEMHHEKKEVTKEEFFAEVNRFNECFYHPDIWMKFYVDGKKLGWDDFVSEEDSYKITDIKL